MTWDRETIAAVLRKAYGDVVAEPVPERLVATIQRLPERQRERR
jgi:hypothetical protein